MADHGVVHLGKVFRGQCLGRHRGHLPKAKTHVGAAVGTVAVLVAHKHALVIAFGHGGKLHGLALLVNQRFQCAAGVQQIPRCALRAASGGKQVFNQGFVAGAVHFVKYRVVGIEEVLAVVAQGGVAFFQQLEHLLVGEGGSGAAHLGKQRRVNADVVILDVVAAYFDRALKVFVGNGVAMRRHIIKGAVAHPLPKARPLAEPAVGVGFGAGWHHGGDVLVLAFGNLQAVLVVFAKAGHQGFKGVRGNNHGCLLLFLFCVIFGADAQHLRHLCLVGSQAFFRGSGRDAAGLRGA